MSRFSNPVRCSSTAANCPDRPMRLRTARGSASTSAPAMRARPASGVISVARIDTAVVLPAPFGPSRPRTVPAATVRSRPSSAVTLPYRFTRPLASTGGGALPEAELTRAI